MKAPSALQLAAGNLRITHTPPAVTAVIVSHNSPPVLKRAVEALLAQSLAPSRIAIIDSGSADIEPIQALATLDERIVVIYRENVGFAAGNNLAMRAFLDQSDYFALVNPDAVLGPDWLAGAVAFTESPHGRGVGIIASPLRGMDVKTEQPTGLWDTLGIYRGATGRWYDRGMQEKIINLPAPDGPYEPTAICGALMFFSTHLYRQVVSPHGFFDERFHTYKEDIELSLRVRRRGFRLVMLPQLEAWHCRGWPKHRSQAPFQMRRLSSRNDILIAARYAPMTLPIYVAKFLYVVSLQRWLLMRN